MATRSRTLLAALAAALAATPALADLPRLTVSEDRRFLQTEDGKPFFYLGDTAWELFHRLDREEASRYLKDRAGKGFNVIQAVALAELDGLNTPTPAGETPLDDNDPTRPNESYFRHVDSVIDEANALGMYVGLLPTWGDKFNKKWGVGPEVFTPENARIYGKFLGERYRDRGIIWILGGDRPIENDQHRAIVEAMAAGLESAHGGRQLMTYHPMGGLSSSKFFHDAPWLDFNMLQSGHGSRHISNDEMIRRDYNREPTKPVLDGEPNYEDHPIGFKAANGFFPTQDIRRQAYLGVFAGGCGHTYGCHDIWQFWQPGRPKISDVRTPWPEALGLPGSAQMDHVRRLMLSRPYFDRVPAPDLIADNPEKGADHGQATRARDGSYAFVYIPTGKPTTVKLGGLSGDTLKAWWFDPRTGDAKEAGTVAREAAREFRPPTTGDDQDWVLVLDDASKGFPAPGSNPQNGD